MWQKYPRLARTHVSLAFILLWVCSTPFIADSLLQTIEQPYISPNAPSNSAEAIVVLTGGSYFNAPEYAGDTVSSASLERARYTAKLYRDIKKPILITGGAPLGDYLSEAQQMREVLEQELNTPVKWLETKSINTRESARYSYQFLQSQGISRIYLVTHAWHMPRAKQAFQAAGFEVVTAPTAYTTRYNTNILSFIPSANALENTHIAMHELIGMLWYRLKS